MAFFKLFVVLAAVLALASALPRFYRGAYHYDEYGVPTNSVGKLRDTQYEFFFEQRLDHFDRQNSATFQQRFFVNETWWSKDVNAPVFLCVGGEGPPLDRTVLVNSVHCNDMVEIAPKHGALLLALEHRYYGPSNPFGEDFSTPNLKWLNTEQALGDIATFHSYISTKYNLTARNKWITFGGSYPGMVAALARYRYPHLIFAAVSSSAPLEAAVEMPGYNNVVAHSMAAWNVGGSPTCLHAIKEGHEKIGDRLKTAEGRRYLEKTFNFCKPLTLDNEQNQEAFAGDGVVYLPVQSNDPSCSDPYCNIKSICDLMTDVSVGTPLERLAALSSNQNGGHCINPSYDAMIKFYTNPKNPDRSWLYQTCSEWGFYQTCNVGSECPYTQGLHTLDVDLELCAKAFGVSSEDVNAQISNTIAIYGGKNIQGSRIFFTNGEIDPWHANSVLRSPNVQELTNWVQGASHHFWTHPSLPTDSEQVNWARTRIWTKIAEWLVLPPDVLPPDDVNKTA
eukprot:gene33113-40055_t